MLRLSYDEISPITGNKSVLVEQDPFTNDQVKLCMESGYQTYLKNWKSDNIELISDLEKQFPEDITKTKIVDSNGNVWYKSYLVSRNVILFPEETVWKVALLVETDPGSGIDVDIPLTPETTVKKFVDIDNAKVFGLLEYENALFEFQQLITITRMKNEN